MAEHIAGSEDAFASMMNQQAVVLGMHASQFANATGLPADGHQSSAWDLALLTVDMINRFPDHYAYYAERSFTFNDIEQPERLGGHRNHHSVFTCQSRFGKTHTPFVSLDQLIAAKVSG